MAVTGNNSLDAEDFERRTAMLVSNQTVSTVDRPPENAAGSIQSSDGSGIGNEILVELAPQPSISAAEDTPTFTTVSIDTQDAAHQGDASIDVRLVGSAGVDMLDMSTTSGAASTSSSTGTMPLPSGSSLMDIQVSAVAGGDAAAAAGVIAKVSDSGQEPNAQDAATPAMESTVVDAGALPAQNATEEVGSETQLSLSSTTLNNVEVLKASASAVTFSVDQADLAADGEVIGTSGTDTLALTGVPPISDAFGG